MAKEKTLHDLFVDELRDAYDSEKQLIKALRQMAKAATSQELADAFTAHLEETTEQVTILEGVFEMLELRPRGKHCAGMAGIIDEGKDAIEEYDDPAVLDVALIAGARRAEHYEMAAYLTLIDLARALGHDEAVTQFETILDQEMASEETLKGLGEQLMPAALDEEDEESEDNAESDEEEEDPSPPASNKRTPAKKAAPKRDR